MRVRRHKCTIILDSAVAIALVFARQDAATLDQTVPQNKGNMAMSLQEFETHALEANLDEAYSAWNAVEDRSAAIPTLHKLVFNANAETREIAIHCLTDIKITEVSKITAACLKDSSQEVRRTAITYLISYCDQTVVPDLISNLKNADEVVRAGVAEVIGRVGSGFHIRNLEQQLKQEPDLTVQKKLRLAMAKLGDTSMKDKIAQQMKVNDSNVRFQAIRDLQYIDDKNLARELLPALDDVGNTYLLSSMDRKPARYARVCDLAINTISVWFKDAFSFEVSNYKNYSEKEIEEAKQFLKKL